MAVISSACRQGLNRCLAARSVSVRFMSTSGSDDSDPKKTKKEAKAKLNQLLGEIKEKNKKNAQDSSKPSPNRRAKPKLANMEKTNAEGLKADVVHAVHRVAHAVAEGEADDDKRQMKVRQTESDLLNKLKSVQQQTEEAKSQSEVDGKLSSLIKNMKTSSQPVDKQEISNRKLSAAQVEFLRERRRLRQQKLIKSVEHKPIDLFNDQPPLGIFEAKDFVGKEQKVLLETWKKCEEREMAVMAKLPPRNFLEDMINMTDKGVLWQFPIDNEQGIDESELEPFYDHVFLDHHLEPWCPKRGPLRHFMELVCVALSKNPHVSSAKKVEHIQWYRDYFEKPEHKDILRASGAYE